MTARAFYITLMLCISLMGYSQQSIPWDDLKKVNDVFINVDSYIIKTQYSLYKGNATTPKESFSGVVKKSKHDMYYKMGQTEVYMKEKKQFLINHDDKFAVVNNQTIQTNEEFTPQAITDKIELLKKTNANVKYSVIDNSTGVFKYYTKNNSPILELHYNKTNFNIKRVVVFKEQYDYDNNGKKVKDNYRVVISYDSITLSPKTITDADFSFDKYVYEDKGEYKLKSAYLTYKLIAN